MLVVGCGHPDCGDDAAGLLVARRLKQLGVNAVETSGEATSLMACWEAAADVLVVDTMLSGARPGSIQLWDARQVPLMREALRCSTHGLGVAEAVELARALGRLPKRLRICGIEGRRFEPGAAPSPEVLEAVEKASRRIAEEVMCTNQGSSKTC